MKKQSLDNHWQAMDVQKAFKRLEGSEDGLSGAQGRQQLEENGPNSLEVEEGAGPLFLLLRQVHNPLIYLLAGAALLPVLVGIRSMPGSSPGSLF